jgi:predicted RNA-binding Zn-ribbon protein involved in translation (DUF1610 family)
MSGQKYTFFQCKNCGKQIFSLYEEEAHRKAEDHMMQTGHVVI